MGGSGSHLVLYAGAAVGGGAMLFLLYQILAELKQLNHNLRPRGDSSKSESSSRSGSSSGGSGRSHRSSSRSPS